MQAVNTLYADSSDVSEWITLEHVGRRNWIETLGKVGTADRLGKCTSLITKQYESFTFGKSIDVARS